MEKIKFTIEDIGIATIIIDNPQKRNILSDDVMVSLEKVIREIEVLGEKVKVLIIQSKFPEFFSAGGDVKEWYSYDKTSAYQKGFHGGKVFQALESLNVVTIAAISGSCLGGGNELALACDYRIATEDARFGQPEVLLGNGLAWGGYYRLVKTIGLAKAKEVILFGKTYTAQESLNMGLINQVVPDWDILLKTTNDLAKSVSINASTNAISKHILNQIGNELVPSNSLVDAFSAAYFAETEDSNRRKRAFLDKRLNDALQDEMKQA